MDGKTQGKNTELASSSSRFLLFLFLSPTFMARDEINIMGSHHLENGW
uniref:Uncharacterized protein n=1 Tax=Rhodnius prolixus TaxID=13249 RepID=T1HWT5_RHOPR